jgi:hypothetical protein
MRRSSLLVFLMSCAAIVQAQNAAPPVPPPACEAAEHRQFDFWLGEWEVYGGPDRDRIVGRNTIAKVATGCALQERWVNTGGRDGHSLNVYERDAKRWTQFWIGSDGVTLRLQGGLRADGAMAMEGALPGAGGGTQRQRIVWTPQPDGSVIQQWDTSDDDGRSWQTAFVGHYRRAGGR